MFKFLHTADIHLDSPMIGLERYPGVPVDDVRQATRKALDNLVSLALEEAVSFVLIAGDLFDGTWKDFNTGLYFGQAMLRLHGAGISALITAGNHDAETLVQKHLRMPESVVWFPTPKPKTHRFKKIGVAVHGQGFASQEVSDNLALNYPDPEASMFNIGLLHTSVDGREGHAPYAPCKLQDLVTKGYDYWALGHVHTAEVLCRDPWVVFPGNTQGRSVRETGRKGCELVTIDDGKVTSVESRSLDVLRWAICRIDASGCSRPDDIVDRVSAAVQTERQNAQGRMLAVRIVVDGACSAHHELVRDPSRWLNDVRQSVSERSNGEAWVEKVTFKTAPEVSIEELRLRDDPLGELVRAIEAMERGERSMNGLMAEAVGLKSDLEELHRALVQAGVPEFAEFDAAEVLRDVKNMLVSRLLSGCAQ